MLHVTFFRRRAETLWICDALYGLTGSSSRIRLLERVLASFYYGNNFRPNVLCHEILELIHRRRGVADLAYLQRESGRSRRTLTGQMRDWLGVSPGRFAHMIRLEYAIARLLHAPESGFNIHDLVYDYSYFDQAHFIHDIKKATGMMPRELRAVRGLESRRGVLYSRALHALCAAPV